MFHQWPLLELPSSVTLSELLSEFRRLRGQTVLMATQGRKGLMVALACAGSGAWLVRPLDGDDDVLSEI